MAVAVAAPVGYDELHTQYRGYVEHVLAQQGIPPAEVADAASDIFARFLKLDILSQFDPDYHIVHGGKTIKANFRTWLTTKVRLYARGQRDRVARRAAREVLAPPSLIADGEASWIEAMCGEVWDDYSQLDAFEFVARMRAYLATLPPRSARDRCDLVALFDAMVEQGLNQGRIDYAAIQDQFQISPTSAYQWVSRLREALRYAATVPAAEPAVIHTWDIYGVTLTTADMVLAIDVLKSSAGGIMVKQPLEKAGSVLQYAPKDWYHPFSAEERELYPELEIDPQTHKKPAGHVRKAVVHRLERMLAGVVEDLGGESRPPSSTSPATLAVGGAAVEALPAPPDDPADLFEAELWRLGAPPAVVDHIKELAQAAYA